MTTIRKGLSTLVGLLFLLSASPSQAVPVKYTSEAEYLAALAALGYNTLPESFEEGEWANVRFPNAARGVTNNGVTWAPVIESGTSVNLTANTADKHDGLYQMFTFDKATFFHGVPDGYTLSSVVVLHAAGGWFKGDGAKLGFTLDGVTNVDFTGAEATVTAWKFLGFIEAAGFTVLEIKTIDEVGGETKQFWSDDFHLASSQ